MLITLEPQQLHDTQLHLHKDSRIRTLFSSLSLKMGYASIRRHFQNLRQMLDKVNQ